MIAKELGCHRSYVYRIENELSTSRQLPSTGKRRGADGKERSTNRNAKQRPVVALEESDSDSILNQQSDEREGVLEQNKVTSPADSKIIVPEQVEIKGSGETKTGVAEEPSLRQKFVYDLIEYLETNKNQKITVLTFGLFQKCFRWMSPQGRQWNVNKIIKYFQKLGFDVKLKTDVEDVEVPKKEMSDENSNHSDGQNIIP